MLSNKTTYAYTLWPTKPFLGICTKGKPEKVYIDYAYKEDYLLGCTFYVRKIEEILCMYIDLCWERINERINQKLINTVGGGRVGMMATEKEMRIAWESHFIQNLLLSYENILYINKRIKIVNNKLP